MDIGGVCAGSGVYSGSAMVEDSLIFEVILGESLLVEV